MIWVELALYVVSFLIVALLAPKPNIENVRASSLDDLRFPRAQEGAPIPLVLGRCRVRSPNTVWYGDYRTEAVTEKVKTGMFSSKRVTVGHKYYVGFHLVLCLGPAVHLRKVWIDKNVVWEGDIGPGESTFTIDKENLFGGEKQGGGFVSTVDFYGGSFTQPVNAYVSGVVGGDYPAYVGQSHLAFRQAYIGMSPQLRPLSFEVEHYPNGLGLTSAVNRIGDDLNPAEVLYQILTADWGGLDVDPNDIDASTFATAASTLADEGNGMSLQITRSNGGKSAVEEVLRQIDAILYQDPSTGKIAISLVRFDYDPLNLDVFDASNITAVRNFSRTSWEDTLNQVRVTYINRANKYEAGAAMVQDMANINAQGRIRTTTVSYPGCSNGAQAVALATRDMTQLSVPLFKATLEVNREGATLRPGDPFVLSWPDYGIESVVMRVQRFNFGELLDGRIVVDAIQDEFATNLTVFAAPEATLWDPIDTTAYMITSAAVLELPYWIVHHQDVAGYPPGSSKTYYAVVARPVNAEQQAYSATLTQGSTTEDVVSELPYGESATLTASISAADGFSTGTLTSITVDNVFPAGAELPGNATTAQTRDGFNVFLVNGELFTYETLTDSGNGTFTLGTVRRALLDTPYEAHASGDVVWFVRADAISPDIWDATTQVTAKVKSHTTNDVSAETSFNDTPDRRYERPLPPDYLTFNSGRTPAEETAAGPHTLDWRPRSRLNDDIRFEDDAADTEEAGVTYTLRFYLDDVLQSGKTQTGLGSPTASFTFDSPTSGSGRFEVSSVRDGLESRTASTLTLPVNVA